MPEVVSALKEKKDNLKLLAANRPLVKAYWPEADVRQISNLRYDYLKEEYGKGYRYLVIDPEKFILRILLDKHGELVLGDALKDIEERCTSIGVFKHLDPNMLEVFLFEHGVGPSHRPDFLKSLPDDAGSIKIYDMSMCFNVLEKRDASGAVR